MRFSRTLALVVAFVISLLLVFVYPEIRDARQEMFSHSAWNGNISRMRVLYALGADVNGATEITFTPLFTATGNCQKEAARFLIERGADVNLSQSVGSTPLMNAAYCGDIETARLLIERGANVNAMSDGGSALRVAREAGKAEIVELLLQHGAK
jgi:uncharacterized protein